MIREYRKRIVDSLLSRRLAGKGAVLVEGLKWCGKTTTAEQVSGSVLYMDDPARMRQNLVLADIDPALLLEGATPRLLDEWQLAPKLWDAVRFAVDHREGNGQFILTGSAVPPSRESIHHSGTGRFAWLKMRTMSLYESGDSTGQVSLRDLFSSPEQIMGRSLLDLPRLAFLTCRGGWPGAVSLSPELALDQAFDYLEAVVHQDISRVDGISRNPEDARALLRSYARHQGSQCPMTSICDDQQKRASGVLKYDSTVDYVNALQKIFLIEDMPAWNPNLRSRTAIRTTATRYFSDPSIATAALGLGPQDLLGDLRTFGFLFETLCARDLRIFADSLDGQVYHYRDKSGLECDMVIHLRNGSYGLVEIKLGGDRLIQEGAENLQTLVGKIDTERMKSPAFQMVLTGVGDYAYRRRDGIYIVPLGCLKN